MIRYAQAISNADLQDILTLQSANLAVSLSPDEIMKQGFVTVHHTFDQLARLNRHEKHLMAKDGDLLAGYVLAMTPASRLEIPVLIPMFDLFDQLPFGDKRLSDYRYITIGQVCIRREYRGTGLFDGCYAAYREVFGSRYEIAVTEIASTNRRSLRAHERIGFEAIHRYTDPEGTEWVIVVWDWRGNL